MAESSIYYSGPVVTVRAAFVAGAIVYFTGVPCQRGHVAQRRVSNGACVECSKIHEKNFKKNKKEIREYFKAWRVANPQARTEEARKYRAKYPEKVAAKSKRWRDSHVETRRPIEALNARIRRAQNPAAEKIRRDRHRLKKVRAQEQIAERPRPSVCDICGGNELRIVFDHCHAHGHFRGWLCDRCNKVLGLLKDSPKLLRKMTKYLEQSNGKIKQQSAGFSPLEGLWDSVRTQVSGRE